MEGKLRFFQARLELGRICNYNAGAAIPRTSGKA